LDGLLAALAVGLIGAVGLGAATLLRPGPGLDLRLHLPAGYPHIHFLVARWILLVSAACLALLASVLGGTLGARFPHQVWSAGHFREGSGATRGPNHVC